MHEAVARSARRKISPPLLDSHSIGELDAGTLRAVIAGKCSLSNVHSAMLPTVFNGYWPESRKQQVNCVQGRPDKYGSVVYKYLDYEYEYEYEY